MHTHACYDLQIGIEPVEERLSSINLALCCCRYSIVHVGNGQDVQVEDARRDTQGRVLIVQGSECPAVLVEVLMSGLFIRGGEL